MAVKLVQVTLIHQGFPDFMEFIIQMVLYETLELRLIIAYLIEI
jgi:hypothetical protein